VGAARRYGGGCPHKKTPAHGGRLAGTLPLGYWHGHGVPVAAGVAK